MFRDKVAAMAVADSCVCVFFLFSVCRRGGRRIRAGVCSGRDDVHKVGFRFVSLETVFEWTEMSSIHADLMYSGMPSISCVSIH